MVRRRGLEPLPIEGPVSKTGVSAIPPAAQMPITPGPEYSPNYGHEQNGREWLNRTTASGFRRPETTTIRILENGRDGVTRTPKAFPHRFPKPDCFHLQSYAPICKTPLSNSQ